MKIKRVELTLRSISSFVFCLAFVALAIVATPKLSYGLPINVGDVFVAVSGGQVQHYDSSLNLLETLNTGQGGFTTGMAFDLAGNLYVTNFSASNITRFDITGAIIAPNPFVTNDAGAHNEAIVFDAAGNFYVSQPDGTKDILKYAADGTFLARYDAAYDYRGTDWIDLAADQTTMFYTSEGRAIQRYDVGTDTQLADFAVLSGSGNAFALRLLGDGGLLVADGSNIKRLDATGAVIDTYDVTGENTWFALNLDPNGTSFWSGNYGSANFYKFDIATGGMDNFLASKNTGTGGNTLYGLTVAGEITQATQVPEPATLLLLGSGLFGLGYFGRKKMRS